MLINHLIIHELNKRVDILAMNKIVTNAINNRLMRIKNLWSNVHYLRVNLIVGAKSK